MDVCTRGPNDAFFVVVKDGGYFGRIGLMFLTRVSIPATDTSQRRDTSSS